MQAIIIINSKNTKHNFNHNIIEVANLLSNNDYEIELYLTKKAHDIYFKVVEVKNQVDLIVITGGDGSMNEVLNALAEDENKPAVMYFPTGTVNDLASTLKIPKNTMTALKKYEELETMLIDSGKVNDKYFNYVCAFGPFTKTSYKTNHKEKKRLGKMAYVKNAFEDVPTITKSHFLKIRADDHYFEGYYTFAMIANSTSVAGFRSVFKKDKLDDGYFNLILVPKASAHVISKTIQYLMFGVNDHTIENDKGYIYIKFKHLAIESDDPIAWSIDGEEGPVGSIEINVINNNLKIIKPQGKNN